MCVVRAYIDLQSSCLIILTILCVFCGPISQATVLYSGAVVARERASEALLLRRTERANDPTNHALLAVFATLPLC